jgi:hypothetical protein
MLRSYLRLTGVERASQSSKVLLGQRSAQARSVDGVLSIAGSQFGLQFFHLSNGNKSLSVALLLGSYEGCCIPRDC